MPDLCLPLLQTCRLVHWEAALISFSSNRFVLKASSPANYQPFLDRLMPAQRAAIRSLRLVFNDFHHAPPQSFGLALPKTTDLAVSIPGDFNSFMTNVYSPWELVEKLHRWPLDRVSVIACPGNFIAESEVRPPRSADHIRGLAALAKEVERRLLRDWDEEASQRDVNGKRKATAE